MEYGKKRRLNIHNFKKNNETTFKLHQRNKNKNIPLMCTFKLYFKIIQQFKKRSLSTLLHPSIKLFSLFI